MDSLVRKSIVNQKIGGSSFIKDQQSRDQMPSAGIKNAAYAEYVYEVENDDDETYVAVTPDILNK